jgi:hypothetical protein
MNAIAKIGLSYAITESNGGHLTLFVFNDANRQTATYAYYGLEHENPETVAQMLRDLADGDNALYGNADDEGVLEDPQTAWDESDSRWIVADNERLYPKRMGCAAKIAFSIPD